MIARSARGLAAAAALCLLGAAAPTTPAERLQRHVEFLAAPDREGRLTGSPGERSAADYLAGELEALGGIPVQGADGFLLGFDFTAGTNDAGSTLEIRGSGEAAEAERWAAIEHVRGLSFSDNGAVRGSPVFAGYGLVVSDQAGSSYDSYAGLDVAGKIVVVLRYWPEKVDEGTRAQLSRYAGLRHKALVARERGASALLVVTGPHSPGAGATIDAKFDAALSGSGIVAASVSGAVADRIFRSIPGGLAAAQSALDTGNPHVRGFDVPEVTVGLEVKVERERRTGHNVVGLLPPSSATDSAERPGRSVVLGAHYDHLGYGRHGNSLAKRDEQGQVHPGADDNASGVAAVLEAGARLAAGPRRGAVILAFWSGEELGLLGSSHFVRQPPLPLDEVSAYLNFDMVGRVRENRLNLQGVGSSPVWPRLIEQTNVVVGFDARTQLDPYLPTDASTWYLAGVPIVGFFSGNHEDYHRPTDRPDTVNYEDLERVARFAAILASKLDRLDERPGYVKVERDQKTTGEREALRAYTGTIPDYATEVEGLRLSGVIAGGPAERAGLREGDVIVEFSGQRIANIYDYTYALGSVKIGESVKVICLRDGERLEVVITPTSRP